jgi:hypothetical protein
MPAVVEVLLLVEVGDEVGSRHAPLKIVVGGGHRNLKRKRINDSRKKKNALYLFSVP